MRVVLDVNVLVAALIAEAGPSRAIITAWADERFALITSPALIDELRDVLERPKFRRWVTVQTAQQFIDGLATDAEVIADPPPIAGLTPDPNDDYLVAPARAAQAGYLVSGDRHLLNLGGPSPPVLTPRQFLDLLEA